jgi:hypothetical protein
MGDQRVRFRLGGVDCMQWCGLTCMGLLLGLVGVCGCSRERSGSEGGTGGGGLPDPLIARHGAKGASEYLEREASELLKRDSASAFSKILGPGSLAQWAVAKSILSSKLPLEFQPPLMIEAALYGDTGRNCWSLSLAALNTNRETEQIILWFRSGSTTYQIVCMRYLREKDVSYLWGGPVRHRLRATQGTQRGRGEQRGGGLCHRRAARGTAVALARPDPLSGRPAGGGLRRGPRSERPDERIHPGGSRAAGSRVGEGAHQQGTVVACHDAGWLGRRAGWGSGGSSGWRRYPEHWRRISEGGSGPTS